MFLLRSSSDGQRSGFAERGTDKGPIYGLRQVERTTVAH
jgi:hypothetical protein